MMVNGLGNIVVIYAWCLPVTISAYCGFNRHTRSRRHANRIYCHRCYNIVIDMAGAQYDYAQCARRLCCSITPRWFHIIRCVFMIIYDEYWFETFPNQQFCPHWDRVNRYPSPIHRVIYTIMTHALQQLRICFMYIYYIIIFSPATVYYFIR